MWTFEINKSEPILLHVVFLDNEIMYSGTLSGIVIEICQFAKLWLIVYIVKMYMFHDV